MIIKKSGRLSHSSSTNFKRYLPLFIKRYKQDNIKKKAGLLTYYSFMAVFPLCLFFMTLINLILPANSVIGRHFMKAISQIIPVLGYQFFHSLHYNRPISIGLISVLIVGMISAFAWVNEFSSSLGEIMNIQSNFYHGLKKIKQNLLQAVPLAASIITMIALFYIDLFVFHGNWLAVVVLIFASALNSYWWYLLLKLCLIKDTHKNHIVPTAIGIGVIVQLMARFGGVLLGYELKHLSSLYGGLAIVLGLAVWLYILTQIIFAIIEIGQINKTNDSSSDYPQPL